MLADRPETRQEGPRAIRIAVATHPVFAFTRRLVAIFGTVAHPCTGFNENVLDVCQFGDFAVGGRITAQPNGDDSVLRVETRSKQPRERALCSGLITTFLKQEFGLGAMLVTARQCA